MTTLPEILPKSDGVSSKLTERRLIFERLLIAGSTPKLAVRHFALLKDTFRLIVIGTKQLASVEAQSDERLANKTQKESSALLWLDRRRVPGL